LILGWKEDNKMYNERERKNLQDYYDNFVMVTTDSKEGEVEHNGYFHDKIFQK